MQPPGHRRRFRRSSSPSWSRIASRLKMPLYAVDGGSPPYRGGFGYSGESRDMNVSVSVRHVRPGGDIEVETSTYHEGHGTSDVDESRLAFDWLRRAVPLGQIVFPLTITADRWVHDVAVDGRVVPFTFVGNDQTWCALGTIDAGQVAAAASGWPCAGLALASVQPSDVFEAIPDKP